MLPTDKTIQKMFDMPHKMAKVGKVYYHVIPDNSFTPKEIEVLRQDDDVNYRAHGRHVYANFLPDDIRPPGVKKL